MAMKKGIYEEQIGKDTNHLKYVSQDAQQERQCLTIKEINNNRITNFIAWWYSAGYRMDD
jgi:hypothetical protein